ncbi:hypothetical protein PDIG_68270 [Penicillium digitatum PHI26]|uniref:DASH complex subunit DAD4 n=11 Tax=Penicillium TaxID=5073 RepID=K9FJM5_PEND2|nr:hypothetical protein PDIP_77560 [Penicillium digitatum Pd1]EKV06720.1 hypothetical protein PDIP_77560 [Penicillium digitatum Pd1]EKV08422.1 hypothetical protein PDIG_68270 [Penicillium digitatum PHI26]KAG0159660.1 hypothetical protein PDIDSM_7183 [Penicillium digitatum]
MQVVSPDREVCIATRDLIPIESKQTPPRPTLTQQFFNLLAMESPHEHQQTVLLSRIITNVEKLNEAIMVMNKGLQEVNIQNMNVELVAQMFKNYQSNVLFHLEATENLQDPS